MDERRHRKRKREKQRHKPVASSPSSTNSACHVSSADKLKPVISSSASASLNKTISKPSKNSSFIDKMRARLAGGHFRMINEKLYTCSGDAALNYFKEDPQLFSVYHAGYQEQMSHWPEQPVNIIIKWLKDHDPSLVVADFGCGDARLSRNVKNKVLSIDLVSNDPSVIACDMSNTPLDSSSVDIAVFCLSLMGVNYPSYLQEANRVLKPRGWLLIAEVKSRLDPNTGGADPGKFIKAVCELGYAPVLKDFSNKMFALFYFKKKKDNNKKNMQRRDIDWPELKACVYKRR
ncbi:unnamed protein product [Cuscuta epithymum]|uniref:Ribosomal RNA-processing protein 8 n=1 Tax=Cuscuta epithymum TaxID=186058 RepID=A0AAV0E2U7_9ASTE|nr:unnamed protein product [Cuscuta epithymum]